MKAMDCPLLIPGASRKPGGVPIPVYCRLPSGRVRVPTRMELESLCFVERHQDCPGYRRWARIRTASGGDS